MLGLIKTKGYEVQQSLFSVLIWPLLSITSLNFFCGQRLKAYLSGGKDVLYDFLSRQKINWAGFRFNIAKRFYHFHHVENEPIQAAVFDDTIRQRRGRKVAATSSHFDHTLGKHVMGQQILEMGLVTQKGYLPLDSQIYVSEHKAQRGKKILDDYRSTVGRSYPEAVYNNKNQILRNMLKRAQRKGIRFTHVMADAWFGNRENIQAAVAAGLTGLFKMKRGNLKYRKKNIDYTATELYALVKRRMEPMKKSHYRTATVLVELNLSNDKNRPDLLPVKLLFSRSAHQNDDSWVVFLATDTKPSAEEILETYAMRWSIEVYFKEAKQHFGLLKEQTGDYAVHYASVHLCAIRFMLVAHRMMTSGESFGTIRHKITHQLEILTFERLLWALFKAVIYSVIDEFSRTMSDTTVALIKLKKNEHVCEWLDNALQLDDRSVQNELKAQTVGAFWLFLPTPKCKYLM
jgi:hypothetical protein